MTRNAPSVEEVWGVLVDDKVGKLVLTSVDERADLVADLVADSVAD